LKYSSLRQAARDLEKNKMLVRIPIEVDPNLEMAEIHRRIQAVDGPAILFEKVKGSPFQAISNLYGNKAQTDFLFRHTIDAVQRVIELKADPTRVLKNFTRYLKSPITALNALPMRQIGTAPILYGRTRLSQLPQVKSWPMDGGAFVTLPQVYTEDPDKPGLGGANIGMYRIQISGNDYLPDAEAGMHYQIHRGIGVHHTKYNQRDEDFKCSIFVGGPPSHALAAIFPLPEGMPETTFAGLLGGRRFRYVKHAGHVLSADADFVITGTIRKAGKKPEGPFGDHLGYYSLQHDFPVLDIDAVYHRKNPLWHFTVVGRPPAEDSMFGYMIHKLVKELSSVEFPGLVDVHAVDAAGVHPLLLAVGQERYMPFRERKPEEILTIANHLLGKGQTSLSKFLIIAAEGDAPELDAQDIPRFFRHVLERVNWKRDLHFQTQTTIDTLDYSGSGWNAGSKVVIACCGPVLRTLQINKPELKLSRGFNRVEVVLPGILAISAPRCLDSHEGHEQARDLCQQLEDQPLDGFPLIVLCDDAAFMAAHVNNFLWAAFTRVNPSHDILGIKEFTVFKHWGCSGSLVFDARIKPHHAPVLETDPDISRKVDDLFTNGGPLFGLDR
jgi:4-hydroxy-3-polyprenylbenzoate decarboxylase